MRRILLSITLIVLYSGWISSLNGFGYDRSGLIPTFRARCHPGLIEMKNGYDSTMISTWSTNQPKDAKSEAKNRATFSVVRVIKDSKQESENIKEGKILAESQILFGPVGQRVLVFGYNHYSEGYKYFQYRMPLTDEMLDYVQNAPAVDAPRTVMLAYLAKHLESTDKTVADDAYRYFEWLFEIKDIPEIREQLSVEQLRKFLANPETPPMRIGLYALLLGYAGDETDIPLLKEISLRPGKAPWEGGILDRACLFEGYLLLARESGLEVLEEAKLRDNACPYYEISAMMYALQFMSEHGEERFTKDRLRQSMRIVLNRSEPYDMAFFHLAKLQDWSVSDRLMELYGTAGYDSIWMKGAIVGYLHSMDATRPKDPTEQLPEHVIIARKHLNTLRDKDPETLKRLEENVVFQKN